MPSEHDAIPVELQEIDTHPLPRGARILVVDDTPANLIAAEAALAPLDRQVVTASSGQDALGRVLEQDFALVILDVSMPEMDGYETARWIRSRQRTAHLPIIFMTAHHADETAILRAYKLGAVDFLAKPFHAEVLRAKASVFVMLFERTEQLATERLERTFENRYRDYETAALRRERDRELEAKKRLARLNDALAEHDRRKDSFMAILAHELRNPLAPLHAALELVNDDPGNALRMVKIFERQTATLVRLVDDLLDLSRIKADKIELRPEVTDLREIVHSAIATSTPLIDRKRHTIEVEASAPTMVVVDVVRIAQVVGNLLNNAAKYTPSGGRITVHVGADDERAFVRVRDNGAGIPSELQQSIFDMFVQERVRSDGSGGLGLGLTLSRRLVEQHRGVLSCHSEGRGKGSTFEVRIPLRGSSFALEERRRTRDLEPSRHQALASLVRTVLIDDNDDARELTTALLRREGYEVIAASDGVTGLELIRQHHPHVAIIDLGLPALDGIGVAEALRTQGRPTTRLIALTGHGLADDRERTRRAGFHAHLVKPATVATIVACIREQLAEPEQVASDQVAVTTTSA